jgi:fatty acid desaturase
MSSSIQSGFNAAHSDGLGVKQAAIAHPPALLSVDELNQFNQRSDLKGWLQLFLHLGIMGGSGGLWLSPAVPWAIKLPALVIYGFSLAAMFAPMHECVHRTAFASVKLNDAVAWVAGLLSFYNSTFYRRYHKWHHRYTQIPGKDPELEDPKPQTLRDYWVELSGWNWWWGKLRGHRQIAWGNLGDRPYLSDTARAEVIRSMRLQLLVYGAAIAASIYLQHPWIVVGWLLPLAIGQPILRAILLAEHTGCTQDDNSLTNTRTTLTWAPVRWLMWNMPFHAEHHLYASIPFHALPAAHAKLGPHFAHVDRGYIQVNRAIRPVA